MSQKSSKKKPIKKTNIRAFSRNVYDFLEELPVAVYNLRTNEVVCVVISEEEGGEEYEL